MGGKGSKKNADPNVLGPHQFKTGRVLGKGSYGKVLAVRARGDGLFYANKQLCKEDLLRKQMVRSTMLERNILASLSHPFLVNLNYAYQTEDDLCMVLDLMPGGDLRFHLDRDSNHERFNDAEIRFLAANVLLVLEYLHAEGVLHRDIKPDNLLLDEAGYACLTDFNISTRYDPKAPPRNYAGTAPYVSPEVFSREPYGPAIDYWSLGVMLYEMLHHATPFRGTREQIRSGVCSSEPVRWRVKCRDELKDFVLALLERDPKRRLCGKAARQHALFADMNWERLVNRQIEPPFVPRKDRANVDAIHDLEDQFEPKKKKSRHLELRDHLQFDGWEFCRINDGESTPQYRTINPWKVEADKLVASGQGLGQSAFERNNNNNHGSSAATSGGETSGSSGNSKGTGGTSGSDCSTSGSGSTA